MAESLPTRLASLALPVFLAAACVSSDPDMEEPEGPLGPPDSAERAASAFADAGRGVSSLGPFLLSALDVALAAEGTPPAWREVSAAPAELPAFAFLDDLECFEITWEGNEATLVFDSCASELTGAFIDGTIVARLKFSPLRIVANLDDFAIGPGHLDGSVELQSNGAFRMDVTYRDEDSTGTRLEEARLALAGSRITISAEAVVDDGNGAPLELLANDVSWAGRCLPGSGSLEYDDGQDLVRMTFSSTTPTRGLVRIETSDWMDEVALFPPCP